jgi:hypothetical protein
MKAATSGVCLVRVEVQSPGLLLTVITDRHDGPGPPLTGHFTDIESAVAAVRDFLATFRHGGLTSHAR